LSAWQATILAFALAGSAGFAQAQDYPARPVRIVVPYAAGGGTDAIARILAKGLEQRLGAPFVIENRGGSGTTLGGAAVARAEPDGYTLLMATSSTLAMAAGLYKKLPYDPTRDFTPISLIATVPFVLIVHPSLGVDSVTALIELARRKPGELSYASGGMGAPHHIYMELLMHMTGIDMKNVPYRGGGPALADVAAGHVKVMFADAAQALALIRDGRVRALGVTTGKRLETMPEVPTLQEAGIAGYEANSWQCVVGPAGLPAVAVGKLNAALVEIMATPETRDHFLKLGWQPVTSTPPELGAYIRAEVERWTKLIKTVGASVE
jgi:tripartite-type tricarboxylate transporter receptor subunit TctC